MATTRHDPARKRGPSARRAGGSLLGAYSGTFPDCRRLGREEEVELTRRAAAGDEAAGELLIEAHFPLLVQTALAFRRSGIGLEDLLGEACAGVLEAIPRFDPGRGFRFMTYAVWWVRRALVRALATQTRNVRIPRHRASWSDEGEGSVGSRRSWPREVSLSEETHGEGACAAGELLRAEQPELDEQVFACEEQAALREALSELPERQRFVVSRRFGLEDDERHTLASIAVELRLTKERVRQIEEQALGRLRTALRPLLSRV